MEPEPGTRPVAGGDETLLLVEDEIVVREYAREVLEGFGYSVLGASGASQALALMERCPDPIHLLITDVIMPGKNGPDLAREVAAQRTGMPVLYVSGYTDDEMVRDGILEPGTWFLQKPFDPETLAGKVREVLDTPRGARAA